MSDLHKAIHSNPVGLTLLSTIFKFEGSAREAANSHNWIILVDECHRTQEKDLGAFLEKTLPHACFIGFTGTSIQTTDKDTYENFSLPGEDYLDLRFAAALRYRYSIDDAVTDGATVPIRYTSRKAEWQVDEKKLNILFDNWFANEPEAVVNKIKARGVKVEDLVKHRERIELLAYDIWTHFSLHAAPEGFKAQIVAIDREAIILYKRALNQIIAKSLKKQGFSQKEADAWADAMAVPVYSSNQKDGYPSIEDKYIDKLRQDLKKYALDKNGEVAAIRKFTGDDAEYEAKVQRGEVPPVQAARKSAELRKIMEQKEEENPLFYGSFSEQVLEALHQFEQGQIEAAETLKRYAQIVRNMQAAESAHQQSNLNQKAYGILKILEAFLPENQGQESSTQSNNSDSADNGLNPLEKAAQAIDELYSSDETAPPGWHLEEQLRKGLRQQVRANVFKLGLKDWKEIPTKVDEYALKHYIKL